MQCEGIALINDDDEIPRDNKCVECKNGFGNKTWIEQTLKKIYKELITKKGTLGTRMTLIKADIDTYENMEAEFSGPKQRQLKDAMKELGDVARYHGGDLQGKQVQKLLDNARGEAEYKLLDCVSEDKRIHEKFKKAIKFLLISEMRSKCQLKI